MATLVPTQPYMDTPTGHLKGRYETTRASLEDLQKQLEQAYSRQGEVSRDIEILEHAIEVLRASIAPLAKEFEPQPEPAVGRVYEG